MALGVNSRQFLASVVGAVVWVAAVAVIAETPTPPEPPSWPWESSYAFWRDREPQTFRDWKAQVPAPKPTIDLNTWQAMDKDSQNELFDVCLTKQAKELSRQMTRYRSPILREVKEEVTELLAQRGLSVQLAVFWGRGRYVKVLWPYLERNLRKNHGIIDRVVLITKDRDHEQGSLEARELLNSIVAQYPGVVEEVPFCPRAYGCAFDEILTDDKAVYLKLDDDIVFIKDGSIEHLVYQVITNDNYTVFSGSVVNNPHGYGIHHFAGAYPETSFHWEDMHSKNRLPFFNASDAVMLYYGKNVYDSVGSKAHEAFIYNVAHGRLDTYMFDLWNINRCRCARPQEGLSMCTDKGFYRWSINAIAWKRNTTSKYPKRVEAFDEPSIGIGWPSYVAPFRAGIVGEALFVHCQYTRQRSSKPDYGLREEILLPWYTELMKQYTSMPYGEWEGNSTLFRFYEDTAWLAGENRFAKWPTQPRAPLPTIV